MIPAQAQRLPTVRRAVLLRFSAALIASIFACRTLDVRSDTSFCADIGSAEKSLNARMRHRGQNDSSNHANGLFHSYLIILNVRAQRVFAKKFVTRSTVCRTVSRTSVCRYASESDS